MAGHDLWVTDRCARDDLGLDEWPDPEGVAGVQHEVVRKFRERRRVDPEPRTLYINDLSDVLGRPCFELKDERFRGASWFDRPNDVVYLIGAGYHASGDRRDVYDRLARISDLLDSFRDELATMLDIYVSQVSNSLNEVMKVLTAITVVIVPVTLVASIYGMNVRFPGIDTRHGFYEAVAIMIVTAVAMLWYFRSRKWL